MYHLWRVLIIYIRDPQHRPFRLVVTIYFGFVLFCLSSSCAPNVASISGMYIVLVSLTSCAPNVASISRMYIVLVSLTSCAPNVASISGMYIVLVPLMLPVSLYIVLVSLTSTFSFIDLNNNGS